MRVHPVEGKVVQIELISKPESSQNYVKQVTLIVAYFVATVGLTLHTKWFMKEHQIPWSLSALHVGLSGLGAYLLRRRVRFALDLKLAAFSSLYALNIALSNVSLQLVSLALHQIIRSGTPLITLVFEYVILGRRSSASILLTLLAIVGGIVLTVIGDLEMKTRNFIGIGLTVLGAVISALKGVLTNLFLKESDPLDLLAKIAPLATIQCAALAVLSGEGSKISEINWNASIVMNLSINAALAFGLNWISFAVNKETSALTLTVAGNVKQAVSVALGVLIFSTPVNVLGMIGMSITLLGGLFYR